MTKVQELIREMRDAEQEARDSFVAERILGGANYIQVSDILKLLDVLELYESALKASCLCDVHCGEAYICDGCIAISKGEERLK